MPDNNILCKEHSGHKARIENLEKDTNDQWESINSAHKRIDGMKNWVIAGMTSLLIQFVITIVYLIARMF